MDLRGGGEVVISVDIHVDCMCISMEKQHQREWKTRKLEQFSYALEFGKKKSQTDQKRKEIVMLPEVIMDHLERKRQKIQQMTRFFRTVEAILGKTYGESVSANIEIEAQKSRALLLYMYGSLMYCASNINCVNCL